MDVTPIHWWRSRSVEERVVAALVAGSALLLAEVRFEHREVLGETWRAWVPLGCGALLMVGGGAALLRWRRGGRAVLAGLFGATLLVGVLGVWFHSGGHPIVHLREVVSAWLLQPGQNGGIRIGSRPPLLAPGAFCGLGLIGLIACARPGT